MMPAPQAWIEPEVRRKPRRRMRSPTSMRKTSPKSLEGKNRPAPIAMRGKQTRPREHARGVTGRQPYCHPRALSIVGSEVAVTGVVDLNCPSVGVYEPARLLLSDGTEHDGSVLTLGQQLRTAGAIVVHERCYAAFTQQRG